jgi:hypothetical protein
LSLLENTPSESRRKEGRLELSGTHQHLLCADDAILLVKNVNSTKENAETVLHSSKEDGREVNGGN